MYGGIVDKLQERFADALLGFDLPVIAQRVPHKERGGYVIGVDDATFWGCCSVERHSEPTASEIVDFNHSKC